MVPLISTAANLGCEVAIEVRTMVDSGDETPVTVTQVAEPVDGNCDVTLTPFMVIVPLSLLPKTLSVVNGIEDGAVHVAVEEVAEKANVDVEPSNPLIPG
jgi:hypothetical protein